MLLALAAAGAAFFVDLDIAIHQFDRLGTDRAFIDTDLASLAGDAKTGVGTQLGCPHFNFSTWDDFQRPGGADTHTLQPFAHRAGIEIGVDIGRAVAHHPIGIDLDTFHRADSHAIPALAAHLGEFPLRQCTRRAQPLWLGFGNGLCFRRLAPGWSIMPGPQLLGCLLYGIDSPRHWLEQFAESLEEESTAIDGPII